MRDIGKNILVIVLLLAIIYSFALSGWTYFKIHEYTQPYLTGKASGVVQFCINAPPLVNTSVCPSTATQNSQYSCIMNVTDIDSNATFSATPNFIDRTYSSGSGLPFNITPTGNVTFTPTNDDVGFFSIFINAQDDSGCTNGFNFTLFNLTVLNINDGPYLSKNITNIAFYEGETIFGIFLNQHFTDPDLDVLTYTFSSSGNIIVEILPSSQISIRSNTCGINDVVIFTAYDPYNLSAESNAVTITCTQPSPPQTPTTGSGGGGSGGGGGAVIPCRPEYECYEYHKCNISNQKVNNCVDKRGCGDEKLITLPCIYEFPKYCNESWVCTDWQMCMPNGTQIRSCSDVNNCNTNLTKPNETQSCEYIGTCTDGIKNCHDGSCEEGIDCGGSCAVCKSIQVPYPFKEEKGIGIYILTGIMLILLAGILTYHYFRKEINAVFAKAGWYLTKKKRKQILLSKEDQKKLMSELQAMEKKLHTAEKKEELYDVVNKYSDSLKYYFSKVIDLPNEVAVVHVSLALDKKKTKIIPVLRRIFKSQAQEYEKVAKTEDLVTKKRITLMIEELRNIVLQTSQYAVGEYSREEQELKVNLTEPILDQMHVKIINAYIALQFVEIDVAKKKYLEISADYEKLSIADEESIFEDIKRLYDNTSYVNGWAWREKKE